QASAVISGSARVDGPAAWTSTATVLRNVASRWGWRITPEERACGERRACCRRAVSGEKKPAWIRLAVVLGMARTRGLGAALALALKVESLRASGPVSLSAAVAAMGARKAEVMD